METLEPLDVLNRLEEESDWNESDEERESGSDDDSGKFDYLTEAQVMYSLFSGRLSVSCRGLAMFFRRSIFVSAHLCNRASNVTHRF